jgi:hypothetical protein
MARSRGGPTRQDTYNVHVSVDGTNLGTWDKLTGGEVDSDEYKYKPGGMAPPVSLGGTRNVGNLTVSRLYRLARDHDRAQWMINRAGSARVVVSKQPLDIDGNVYGRPIVYRGTLKRVTFPEHDSESNNPGLLEIEVTVGGYPTAN